MKEISTRNLILVGLFLAAVVGLKVTGHEDGTLVAILLGILGAVGYGVAQVAGAKEQTQAVKEQTNGNHSLAMSMIDQQGKLLAVATLPDDVRAALVSQLSSQLGASVPPFSPGPIAADERTQQGEG